MVADSVNYTILCTLDEDDSSMNSPEIINRVNKFPNTIVKWGSSKSKIDAINRDIEIEDKWDILVCMSDDMRFVAYGFDSLIREAFINRAPNLLGYMHFPDTTAKNALCTMTIIGKAYYILDGYIYNPCYLSLFADNEGMEVAMMRNMYYYIDIPILDHLHPAYGLSDWDEQYRQQQSLWTVDETTYNQRKSNNFFINAATTIDPYSDSDIAQV